MTFIPLVQLEKFSCLKGSIIIISDIKYLLYTSTVHHQLFRVTCPYLYTDSNTPEITLK